MQIPERRTAHKRYIKTTNCIVYGGVILTDDNNYKGICYFIEADEIKEAKAFVQNDPYFPLYEHVEVDYFDQKIPGTQ